MIFLLQCYYYETTASYYGDSPTITGAAAIIAEYEWFGGFVMHDCGKIHIHETPYCYLWKNSRCTAEGTTQVNDVNGQVSIFEMKLEMQM